MLSRYFSTIQKPEYLVTTISADVAERNFISLWIVVVFVGGGGLAGFLYFCSVLCLAVFES